MARERRRSQYFVAGGTLRPSVPSYVKRPSDDELLSSSMAGEFCYVLTPRQMGKSSLMIRTAGRLRDEDVQTVIIDLTEIGTVSIDEWYQGLITEIKRSLRLQIDVNQWWTEQAHLGQPQRFRNFLQDVVLEEIDSQIVIFIDEIDSTLKLDFRDDFFAVIRALYNGRSREPELARLSFVLLGVASPSDLIKDRSRTPFNIGHEINLQEITRPDAAVFVEGLNKVFPNEGESLFDRIYYWTCGHPYLTQKLCATVTQSPGEIWSDPKIDALVQRTFITDEARGETNIQFVNDLVTNHPKKASMLKIYRRIYKGEAVSEEKTSPEQSVLKLSGLVKVENGRLVVRNQIYRQAFDLKWVKEHTAVNWQLIVTIASVSIAVLALGFLGFNFYQSQKADDAELAFRQGVSPDERADALMTLFGMRPLPLIGVSHDLRAYDLFFELDSWEEQAGIYESADRQQLVLMIQKMYVTMALIDPVNDNSTHALEKMSKELEGVYANPKAQSLMDEIDIWLSARASMKEGDMIAALDNYNEAIAINDQNPATRFEKARILANMVQYEESLKELDSVMALAGQASILEATDTPTPGENGDLIATPTSINIQTQTPLDLNDATTMTPTPRSIDNDQLANVDASNSTPETVLKPIFRSEFVTRGQIISAINKLILEYSGLASYLSESEPTSFQNLAEFGLIPNATQTPEAEVTITIRLTETSEAFGTNLDTPTPSQPIIESTLDSLEVCIYDVTLVNTYTYQNENFDAAPIGEKFPVNWVLENSGTCPWRDSYAWVFEDGEEFGYAGDPIPINALGVGEQQTLTIDFDAPSIAGQYRSIWKLIDTNSGEIIGSPVEFTIATFIPATPSPIVTDSPDSTPTPEADSEVEQPLDLIYVIDDCEYIGSDYRCQVQITPYGGGGGPYTIFVFDSEQPAEYRGIFPVYHFASARRCVSYLSEIMAIDDATGTRISKQLFFDPNNYFPEGCVLP